MDPLILTVACTGGKWTREDSPWVPMSPEQIVMDTVEAYRAGAVMAHIHARDKTGNPSHAPELFARVIEPIKAQCPGIIIQISTGYMEGEVKQKLEPLLKLRPDMASFNLKGSREETLLTAELMANYKVRPVVECFSQEMLAYSKELIQAGVLKKPVFYEFVFDLTDTGDQFEPLLKDLTAKVENFPAGNVWSQTRGAFWQRGLQAVTSLLGGHLRTGLEDNLFVKPGVMAKKSADLIRQAKNIAEATGREIADPEQSRHILGL